jgi:acyl-CoA synthetase (NDP forming)
MALEALFQPNSVAVVGASTNPEKIGGMAVRLLKDCGFEGPIYPVNPTAREVQALPSFASLAALPAAPDVAIIAVPAPMVEAAIEECIAFGVRAAVVFSSGFAEAGMDGLAAQERLGARAADSGLTLLGPNCLGVINVRRRWVATFSPAPLAGLPMSGNVAIVSQSGAFGAYAFVLARKAGLGLSHWVTTGNQASVSVAEVIEWLADDDQTQVIVAYIEGARDGRRLREALLKARRAGKPVIVTKVGRTEAGAKAAMSHTASLSGDDALYQAVIEETGAVRAHTVEEMFRLAQAFSLSSAPKGRRLGIITVSGGVGTMMADTASDEAMSLPALPEHIAKVLRQRVAFCSTANPVDVTGQIVADYTGTFHYTAVEAARSGAFDALILFLAAAGTSVTIGSKVVDTLREMRAVAPDLGLVLTGLLTPEQARSLADVRCLTYEEPTHGIEVMARMARWREARIVDATQSNGGAACIGELLRPGTLNEVESMALLQRHGIPSAPYHCVRDADAAVAAWRKLGAGEVVQKVVSRDILHKSDVGGVRVGLRSELDVREAYEAIVASVARHAPAARREGMLVVRRLRPQLELLLGARHDAMFGTVLVLGLGGVGVELNPRTAILSAPAHPERIRHQLESLGVLTLMSGWRGNPVIDPAELIETVVRFSALAAHLGASLEAMEVNPLMVTTEGVFAADAVVQTC